MRAAADTTQTLWPGVPLLPLLLVGATDGRFLINAGIPTYGLSGMFVDENTGVHGLNEHISVKSLYEGQEFLYRVIKALSQSQKIGSVSP